MANPWFKFYAGDYLADPKMLSLCASMRSCWITLLAYACAADEGGVVRYLDEEQLMIQAGVSPQHEEWEYTKGVLAKFAKLGMIVLEEDETIRILNWEKRQESYLTGAERQAKFREKRKSNADVTRVSQKSNGRIDIEVDKDKNTLAKTQEGKFNALGAEIIKAFEAVDPKNKGYYGNTTQRKACDFLLKEYGLEEVLKRIAILPKTNKTSFFPNITTPVQLRDKWVALQDAADRRRSESKIKNPVAFV